MPFQWARQQALLLRVGRQLSMAQWTENGSVGSVKFRPCKAATSLVAGKLDFNCQIVPIQVITYNTNLGPVPISPLSATTRRWCGLTLTSLVALSSSTRAMDGTTLWMFATTDPVETLIPDLFTQPELRLQVPARLQPLPTLLLDSASKLDFVSFKKIFRSTRGGIIVVLLCVQLKQWEHLVSDTPMNIQNLVL